MKTPKDILKNRFSNSFVDLHPIQESMVIECMLEYAMQEAKNLTIPRVSGMKEALCKCRTEPQFRECDNFDCVRFEEGI